MMGFTSRSTSRTLSVRPAHLSPTPRVSGRRRGRRGGGGSGTGLSGQLLLMTPLRLFLTLLGGILRPFVSGSHLFGVRPWSTGLWTFLGEYFRICRIQCFLGQQWIHVYVSLRRRGFRWWRCTSRCVPLRCADEGKTHHQLLTVP